MTLYVCTKAVTISSRGPPNLPNFFIREAISVAIFGHCLNGMRKGKFASMPGALTFAFVPYERVFVARVMDV